MRAWAVEEEGVVELKSTLPVQWNNLVDGGIDVGAVKGGGGLAYPPSSQTGYDGVENTIPTPSRPSQIPNPLTSILLCLFLPS